MPYKIYTYEDPYRLDEADFWPEIAGLPHFCGARTLVNGLKDVLGDRILGLICPLDDLVRHERVYQSWTDNVGLRVQQYSALTKVFKDLDRRRAVTPAFYMALTQNQGYFLEAMRLFVELGIPASALDRDKGNQEQRLFTEILGRAQTSGMFTFPQTPDWAALKEIIASLARQEVKDCTGPQREKNRCSRAAEWTAEQPLETVVVHGVHRFSPVQLRLLTSMEQMGITVIFLFNYQKKYPRIYASWSDIYSCFDTPFRHDTAVPEYRADTMQNPSNALACALGTLWEGRDAGGASLRQWRRLYQSVELVEFANVTEYAHFISNHFEDAIRRYAESRGVMERGNDVWNKAAVLRQLDEQVYTANRDVHTLLKIYYPEYAKDRHFLSYPIGQFFAAIYRLWDYERQEIRFDIPAVKECLSSNILRSGPGEVLLRTFCNVEPLFENITTFSQFRREIGEEYWNNYLRVAGAVEGDPLYPLRRLSVYNAYKAPGKDVKALIQGVEEINGIAKYLFALDRSQEDFISFGAHFHKLEEFLRQRELLLANEQERTLIQALQARLDQVRPERSSFSGTFRDLREGLHFYLKQKDDGDQGVDWIVKNFEQIDGDILQSRGQFAREERKTYHFACLSDRDMNQTVNDQLPWPLTDEFIRTAYTPSDLRFQVYYTALGARSSFLRYALFYGLCYNRCGVRLSYVRQYGGETTEPYVLLGILGLVPKAGPVEAGTARAPFTMTIPREPVKRLAYDRWQMMDMFLCPYRFFLDYVVGEAPVVQSGFLYQKYYENLLIDAAWRRVQRQPKAQAQKLLSRIVDEESRRLEPYFRFWKGTEIYDLKRRAWHYLSYRKAAGDGVVEAHSPEHMRVRFLFGAAWFGVETGEAEPRNPYGSFERLTGAERGKKIYSLNKLPGPGRRERELTEALQRETLRYLEETGWEEKMALPADWCRYCVHRGSCMAPFLGRE